MSSIDPDLLLLPAQFRNVDSFIQKMFLLFRYLDFWEKTDSLFCSDKLYVFLFLFSFISNVFKHLLGDLFQFVVNVTGNIIYKQNF